MTCAGLLGMALALGLDLELQTGKAGPGMADPAVKKALAYLGGTIGKPTEPVGGNWKGKGQGKGKKGGRLVGADARGDLYYLWSVERVAVIFGLRNIGDK